jgi:hypothetical protein
MILIYLLVVMWRTLVQQLVLTTQSLQKNIAIGGLRHKKLDYKEGELLS